MRGVSPRELYRLKVSVTFVNGKWQCADKAGFEAAEGPAICDGMARNVIIHQKVVQ